MIWEKKGAKMTELLVLAPTIISGLTGSSLFQPNDFYVKTEEVPENSVFYVEQDSAKAIANLGWDIQKDGNGYFYKTTKEKQKIVSVTSLTDPLKKLREQIVAVENTAITCQAFLLNPDPMNMNNMALSYLRSFNKGYVNDSDDANGVEWLAVAGPTDVNFNLIADAVCDNNYYFSQFVSNNDYSDDYHLGSENPHKNERSSNGVFARFRDPITERAGIDLIHMFASLDGCYNYTLFDFARNQYIPHIYPELVHDLVSWAGDLQQATNSIQRNINDKNSKLTQSGLNSMTFAGIMNGGYGISEDDLYADMDAVNIANYNLNGAGRLSDAIVDYYSSINVNFGRSYKFRQSVLKDQNQNWEGDPKQQFRQEVFDMLGLSYQEGRWVDSDEYKSRNPKLNLKFKLLEKDGITTSHATRQAVAEKFCDYIFSLC